MGSVFGERNKVDVKAIFDEAMVEAQKNIVKQLEIKVAKNFGESIREMLEREPYERREKVGSWVEIAGECQRCKSRQSQRFSRNGGRGRTLESQWGMLRVWQQRLVCECGGSVRLEIEEWLRPYQRIGTEEYSLRLFRKIKYASRCVLVAHRHQAKRIGTKWTRFQ